VGRQEVAKVIPRKPVDKVFHQSCYLLMLVESASSTVTLTKPHFKMIDSCTYTSLFQRMNLESRKSPKLLRVNQEGQRSPRLPTKKPPVRSPSLTRREFSMDGITEVRSSAHSLTMPLCLSGKEEIHIFAQKYLSRQ